MLRRAVECPARLSTVSTGYALQNSTYTPDQVRQSPSQDSQHLQVAQLTEQEVLGRLWVTSALLFCSPQGAADRDTVTEEDEGRACALTPSLGKGCAFSVPQDGRGHLSSTAPRGNMVSEDRKQVARFPFTVSIKRYICQASGFQLQHHWAPGLAALNETSMVSHTHWLNPSNKEPAQDCALGR